MSGIYFHIPFCKTRCHYCDFHTSCDLDNITSVVEAERNELINRTNYLANESVRTIYFGGGTPSLLSPEMIQQLIESVYDNFECYPLPEITMECNPDDLTIDYLTRLREIGINRLSIGTQSFDDGILKSLNRRHSAQQAVQAIKNAQNIGFDNISVDLIYGIPGLTSDQWATSVELLTNLNIQHVSAYHLTFHEGTVLHKRLKQGLIHVMQEEESFNQFKQLIETLKGAGFVQYEISNFGLEGYYSKHNSAYWLGTKYLGIGPSAHSFNGTSRQWNISDNTAYCKRISTNTCAFEKEDLLKADQFNDYIITRLRTIWGISRTDIQARFGVEFLAHLDSVLLRYVNSGHVRSNREVYTLSEQGLFISDRIMEDLFWVD